MPSRREPGLRYALSELYEVSEVSGIHWASTTVMLEAMERALTERLYMDSAKAGGTTNYAAIGRLDLILDLADARLEIKPKKTARSSRVSTKSNPSQHRRRIDNEPAANSNPPGSRSTIATFVSSHWLQAAHTQAHGDRLAEFCDPRDRAIGIHELAVDFQSRRPSGFSGIAAS